MKWTAKIKTISNVDAGGDMEVSFDILEDKKVIYPDLRTQASADSVINNIKNMAIELQKKVEIANTLQIGQEIEI